MHDKPSVCKLFLRAHMNMKAQVIHGTGVQIDKAGKKEDVWPVSEWLVDEVLAKRAKGDGSWREDVEKEEQQPGKVFANPPWVLGGKFAKIQDFQYNQIGPELKKMVILFDSMTQQDKDQIETDEEIVINYTNLARLCENAMLVKNRRPKKEWAAEAAEAERVEAWKRAWADYKGYGDTPSSWNDYVTSLHSETMSSRAQRLGSASFPTRKSPRHSPRQSPTHGN